MCGLLAMHSSSKSGFFNPDLDKFKMMLELTSFRGSHSTGITGIDLDSTNKASIIKAMYAPHYLYNFTESEEFFKRAFDSYSSMMGHCRYATKGAINALNAHPYKEGNIILAHNGVINNYASLRDPKKHSDIDVDSHLIARLFNEEGIPETLEKIDGAFVFMWFNELDRTFNIARNLSRPLYKGLADSKNLLFASEKETLEWNASRNKTKTDNIEMLEPNKIFTWTASSLEPIETTYKPYTKVYPVYNNYSSKSYGSDIKDNLNLTNGEEVIFDIIDYSTSYGFTKITGTVAEYPDVLFKATYNYPVSDNILAEHSKLKGRIKKVAKTSPHSLEDYIVYVQPISLIKDVDEVVKISNLDNKKVSLTREKYSALVSGGVCPWCDAAHTVKGTVLKNVLYDETEDAIICSLCSSSVLNYHETYAEVTM